MSKKHDLMNMEPYSGHITRSWKNLPAYAVIFQDGSKGTIRSAKSRRALMETGKYTYVRKVMAEPTNQ